MTSHRWLPAPHGETWVQCAKCHEWGRVGGRTYDSPCDMVDADLVERWLAHAREYAGPITVAHLEAILSGEEPPSQEREGGHGAQTDDGHPTSPATPRAPGATEKKP